jgi:hypothetical protein
MIPTYRREKNQTNNSKKTSFVTVKETTTSIITKPQAQ